MIWQEKPPRSKRTPRVYLRDRRQGLKFEEKKEQASRYSLMEKVSNMLLSRVIFRIK